MAYFENFGFNAWAVSNAQGREESLVIKEAKCQVK